MTLGDNPPSKCVYHRSLKVRCREGVGQMGSPGELTLRLKPALTNWSYTKLFYNFITVGACLIFHKTLYFEICSESFSNKFGCKELS